MPMLGLDVPRKVLDELFDSWDPDGSGSIEMNELMKALREDHNLDPKLRAGGAGAIETASTNQYALRKEAGPRTALRKVDLDESPGAPPVADQLRDVLSKQAVRVIELFREMDIDAAGAEGAEFALIFVQLAAIQIEQEESVTCAPEVSAWTAQQRIL